MGMTMKQIPKVQDARSLMIDRRDVQDCVHFRPLSGVIALSLEWETSFLNIHDWYWCIKGTRGYRSRVHPL